MRVLDSLAPTVPRAAALVTLLQRDMAAVPLTPSPTESFSDSPTIITTVLETSQWGSLSTWSSETSDASTFSATLSSDASSSTQSLSQSLTEIISQTTGSEWTSTVTAWPSASPSVSPTPHVPHSELYDAWALLILAFLLLLTLFSAYVIKRHRISYLHETVLSVVLGLIVGGVVKVLPGDQVQDLITFDPRWFFNLLLPPILLNSGYEMRMVC